MSPPTLLLTPTPPTPTHTHIRPHLLSPITSMPHLHQLHSQLIRLGLHLDNHLTGRLIKFSALSPSGDRNYALALFRSLPNPDPFIFNTLIQSLSAQFYALMLSQPLQPNSFTFPCLLNRITNNGHVEFGRMVHTHVVKFGVWGDGYVMNGLVHMYLSFGEVGDALKVFDGMEERSVVSWTTAISGLARLGLVDEARELFDGMDVRCSVSWNAMIAAYVQVLSLVVFFLELANFGSLLIYYSWV